MKHTSYPCAKINLGLNIVERRPDRYHNIETIFYPIPLCDELEIEESAEDNLILSGIPVAGELNDNLVMKVLSQLRADHDIPPVCITLKKNIPSGAGLGGGSSDAAETMKALNSMFDLGMGHEEMERRVAKLGADCAFFIKREPTVAKGIGNIFTPTDVNLEGLYLALIKPDEFVSTKEAYSLVNPQKPKTPVEEVVKRPIREWKTLLKNDFEASVFTKHPVISEIKENLYILGAEYVSMSGSGSSVFGLFKNKPKDIDFVFGQHFTFTSKL